MVASASYHIKGNSFFIVVVSVFCLMTHPSAPFASEQVPAACLSPVLAPLGSSLPSRRDVSCRNSWLGGFGQQLCPWVSSSPGAENPSLFSVRVVQTGELPETGEQTQQTHELPFMVSPLERDKDLHCVIGWSILIRQWKSKFSLPPKIPHS